MKRLSKLRNAINRELGGAIDTDCDISIALNELETDLVMSDQSITNLLNLKMDAIIRAEKAEKERDEALAKLGSGPFSHRP